MKVSYSLYFILLYFAKSTNFVNLQICGNLIEGTPYYFTNMQYNCVLDIYSCNMVPGTLSITWYKFPMSFGHYNQFHYIKKVAWSNDTFLIMTALDFLALDVCDGYLTRASPTCTSSQLFKSVPGPSSTCYLVPQPMCSNNVLGNPSQNSNCNAYATLDVEPATSATYQQWTFTQSSLVNWTPTYPACASSTMPPSCPTFCGSSTTLPISKRNLFHSCMSCYLGVPPVSYKIFLLSHCLTCYYLQIAVSMYIYYYFYQQICGQQGL